MKNYKIYEKIYKAWQDETFIPTKWDLKTMKEFGFVFPDNVQTRVKNLAAKNRQKRAKITKKCKFDVKKVKGKDHYNYKILHNYLIILYFIIEETEFRILIQNIVSFESEFEIRIRFFDYDISIIQ